MACRLSLVCFCTRLTVSSGERPSRKSTSLARSPHNDNAVMQSVLLVEDAANLNSLEHSSSEATTPQPQLRSDNVLNGTSSEIKPRANESDIFVTKNRKQFVHGTNASVNSVPNVTASEIKPNLNETDIVNQTRTSGIGGAYDVASIVTTDLTKWYLLLTRATPPANPNPVKPYIESRPDVCHESVHCDSTRPGLGRRNMSSWVGAVLAPCVIVSMVILGTSMKPLSQAKIDVNTTALFAAMLLAQLCVACYGVLLVDMQTNEDFCLVSLISCFAFAAFVVITFWCGDVEFARPNLFANGAYLQCVSFLLVANFIFIFLTLSVCSVTLGSRRLPPPQRYPTCRDLLYDVANAVACFAPASLPRNIGGFCWMYCLLKIYIMSFYYWGDTTGDALWVESSGSFPTYCLHLVFALLSFSARYWRDRCFVAAIGCLSIMTIQVGMHRESVHSLIRLNFSNVKNELWGRFAEVVIASFLCCLAMRYQIALPLAVQKIRFLRLGYVRDVLSAGRMIVRCQEQPELAFGNPAKATRLIIVSHHWLDGITCDVPTRECPHGLRLTAILQRLEPFFPTKWPGSSALSRPFSAFAEAVASAAFSEHDVLVFWDFPCMPQIGKAPDGTLIQRTEQDLAIFKEVLPACGLLYTMFPVLICPEVTEGVAPYSASGWCFCEQEQAQLCGTLKPYSEEFYCADSSAFSIDSIEAGLKERQFRTEGDREVVRSIVMGTHLRRELLASVIAQDATRVKSLLQEVTDSNLGHTIDFPVDSETLDALLHVAYKKPSLEIRKQLIDYGADPQRPNHRGERPGEFLILPRSWIPCL